MQRCIRKITKEVFDRAENNHGHILDSDRSDVFTASELYGYGVYQNQVFTKENEYFVAYEISDSCD